MITLRNIVILCTVSFFMKNLSYSNNFLFIVIVFDYVSKYIMSCFNSYVVMHVSQWQWLSYKTLECMSSCFDMSGVGASVCMVKFGDVVTRAFTILFLVCSNSDIARNSIRCLAHNKVFQWSETLRLCSLELFTVGNKSIIMGI